MLDKKRIFKFEKSQFKPIKYIYTSPFLFDNYGFNNKTLYKIIYSDVINKYNRMKDNNVLYPIIFNTLSILDSEDLKHEYYNILTKMKIGFDIDKTIYLDKLSFINFVQNCFYEMYNKNIITLEERDIYRDINNNQYLDSQIYSSNDKYYLKNTSEEVNKITSNVFLLKYDSILDKLSEYESILDMVSYDLGLVIDLVSKENMSLTTFIKYPQYLAAINYICLNPKYIDVLKYTSKIEEDIIKKHILNPSNFDYMTGIRLVNPLTGNDILVFSSYKYDCDIHIGYSSIFEEDKEFTMELELDNYDILEDNHLINSDFLTGLEVNEAKNIIIDTFLEEELADTFKIYKDLYTIISKVDNYGLIIPLYKNEKNKQYILDNSKYPIYFNDKYRVVINNDQDLESGIINKFVFTNEFIEGLLPIYASIYDKNIENIKYKTSDNSIDTQLYIEEKDIFMITLINELFNNPININEIKYCPNVSVSLIKDFSKKVLSNVSVDAYRMFLLINDITLDLEHTIDKCLQYDSVIEDMKLYFSSNVGQSTLNDIDLHNFVITCEELLENKKIKVLALKILEFYKLLKSFVVSKKQAHSYITILSLICPQIAEYLNSLYNLNPISIFYSEFPN